VVVDGTAGELFQQPVVGLFGQALPDQRVQQPVIVVLRVPVLVRIHLGGCHHETILLFIPTHRCVGPERQVHLFLAVVAGRQQGAGITRRHEGRDRLGPAPQAGGFLDRAERLRAPVPGDRRGVGDGKQAAAFRQGNQFNRFRQYGLRSAHPGHGQKRVVVNLALGISVNEVW